MITLLFFAQLREQLDCASLDHPLPAVPTVGGLRAELMARGETWSQVFADKNVLAAVNQRMARDDASIADGDEVAFFPPVTGG